MVGNKTDTAPTPMSLEGETQNKVHHVWKTEKQWVHRVCGARGLHSFEELKDPVSPSNESLNPDWKVSRSGPSRKGRERNAPGRRMC